MTNVLPNPQRGEIEIELGGAKVKLVPSFAAMARIERLANEGIMAFARRFQAYEYRAQDVKAVIQGAAAGELPKDLDAAIYAAGIVQLGIPLGGLVIEMVTGGRVGNAETPAAETTPAPETPPPTNSPGSA